MSNTLFVILALPIFIHFVLGTVFGLLLAIELHYEPHVTRYRWNELNIFGKILTPILALLLFPWFPTAFIGIYIIFGIMNIVCFVGNKMVKQ